MPLSVAPPASLTVNVVLPANASAEEMVVPPAPVKVRPVKPVTVVVPVKPVATTALMVAPLAMLVFPLKVNAPVSVASPKLTVPLTVKFLPIVLGVPAVEFAKVVPVLRIRPPVLMV